MSQKDYTRQQLLEMDKADIIVEIFNRGWEELIESPWHLVPKNLIIAIFLAKQDEWRQHRPTPIRHQKGEEINL